MTADPPKFASVEELLADARSRLPRLDVTGARDAIDAGAGLVDIRPAWLRARDGEIEGSLIIERNQLEWRLHPSSDARLAHAARAQRWIVVCAEGYTSSLAADALRSLGIDATDLIGGVQAWRDAGEPVQATLTPADSFVTAGRSVLDVAADLGSGDFRQLGGPDVEGKPSH